MTYIFGVKIGDVFVEGLVDAMDDDGFQKKLNTVTVAWEDHAVSSTADVNGFIKWFKLNKSLVVRDHMLRPIREECGLGCPPQPFTTNASESVNAILKNKVNFKKTELPLFIENVKDLVKEQRKEIERAIIGRGKYELKKGYKFLEVPEEKWFLMNASQRQSHLAKLQSVSIINEREELVESISSHSTEITSPKASISELSVNVNDASQQINIP